MDIEELNKNQIVLLVLLVSFVTSIATGIVTVTLMDQAPPAITQTINRVVERTVETVEKVVVDESGTTRVEEVIVSEENAIADAVAGASPSLVRLYTQTDETETFSSLAFPVSEYGVLVTDAELVVADEQYSAHDEEGRVYVVEVVARDLATGVAVVRPTIEKINVMGAAFGNEVNFKLGQRIIALGGKETNEIASGMIVSDPTLSPFSTDITQGSRFVGGMALTLGGNVAGMIRSFDGDIVVVCPSSILATVRTALGMNGGSNSEFSQEESSISPEETLSASVVDALE
jgi:S1-C subfamily serine protease